MTVRRFVPLLLALPLVAFGCRAANNENTNENQEIVNQAITNTSTPRPSVNVPVVQRTKEQELQQISRSFAERYGSFSNTSNYENLESLYPFMTERFRAETEAFVAAERRKTRDTSTYYGITTRAVDATTLTFDDDGGQGDFLVATFRTEAIGTTNNTDGFQENLLVQMEREAGTWKVDRATWQEP